MTPHTGPSTEIPDGISPDAAQTWPPSELIESFLGSFDFSALPDDERTPEDQEAARQFRTVLGRFASGVTIVTCATLDGPIGMTCQSFSSVSLKPPLVLIVLAKTSRTWPLMRKAGHFAINLLASSQEQLSNQFATSGADKFAGVVSTPGINGDPHLAGSLGHIDCTVHAVHEAGDHYLVVGQVQQLVEGETEEPLLFYRSSYRYLS